MKKIFWATVLLIAFVTTYLILRCHQVQNLELSPVELVDMIQKRISSLQTFTIVSGVLLLFFANVMAYTTNQPKLLYMPFVFFSVGMIFSYIFVEQLFIFKKQHGMWNGSFSLSLFAGIIQSIAAFIVVTVNFMLMKWYIRKTPYSKNSKS